MQQTRVDVQPGKDGGANWLAPKCPAIAALISAGVGHVASVAAGGEPAPETVRQLMRHVLTHQADQLQDDASMVILEWRTGDETRLRL